MSRSVCVGFWAPQWTREWKLLDICLLFPPGADGCVLMGAEFGNGLTKPALSPAHLGLGSGFHAADLLPLTDGCCRSKLGDLQRLSGFVNHSAWLSAGFCLRVALVYTWWAQTWPGVCWASWTMLSLIHVLSLNGDTPLDSRSSGSLISWCVSPAEALLEQIPSHLWRGFKAV